MIEYTGNRVSRRVIKDFEFNDPNKMLPSAKLQAGSIVTGVDYPNQGMWVDVYTTSPARRLYFNVPYEYLDTNIATQQAIASVTDIGKKAVTEAEKAASTVSELIPEKQDNKILLMLAAVVVFIILISK